MTEDAKKPAKKAAASVPWYEREFPETFQPKPTVIDKFSSRLITAFESTRKANVGGYGELWVKQVNGWWGKDKVRTTTSCSPWTGTVLGMLLDKNTDLNSDGFSPVYDTPEKPLPFRFYEFHNTSLGGVTAWTYAAAAWFKKNNTYRQGVATPYDPVGACVLFNLGYEIDPRDMRKGDLVGIQWGGMLGGNAVTAGHCTFCWDAHTDADGAVDAFTYISANGNAHPFRGPGVSVAPGAQVAGEAGSYHAKAGVGQAMFFDRVEYITSTHWFVLPHLGLNSDKVLDQNNWSSPPGAVFDQSPGDPKVFVQDLTVCRFWGNPPPDATTTRGKAAWADTKFAVKFPLATTLTKEKPMIAYAVGTGPGRTNPAVHKAKPAKVPVEKAKVPAEVKKVPTTPVVQKVETVKPHQHDVEAALGELYRAKWIEKDPGDAVNVNDSMSFAAIEDFQLKWGLDVDGIVGDQTRPALTLAVITLRAGQLLSPYPPPPKFAPAPKRHAHATKPAPSKTAPPPAADPPKPPKVGPVTPPRPSVDHFYFLANQVLPKATVRYAIEGKALDLGKDINAKISFREKIGEDKLADDEIEVTILPVFKKSAGTQGIFNLPDAMTVGKSYEGSLSILIDGYRTIVVSSKIELNIVDHMPDQPKSAATTGWPWDESVWPKRMRNIIAELRATEVPKGPFTAQWCLSTFGVKERMNSTGPIDKKTKKPRFADAADKVDVLEGEGKGRTATGSVFGQITKYSLWQADIEGTMRFNDRVLNIIATGRPRGGAKPHNFEEFDASASLWTDVTDGQPWGAGSVMPLIPFRVLAIGAADTNLYFKKVYIAALDGMVLTPNGDTHNGICVVGDRGDMDAGVQFDFFKGREDVPFVIDGGLGKMINKAGTDLPLSYISVLDTCVSALPKNRNK